MRENCDGKTGPTEFFRNIERGILWGQEGPNYSIRKTNCNIDFCKISTEKELIF